MGSCQIQTVCLGNWKRCKRKYQSQFEKPEKEVNNLYPTEDGKASEEAHSASYQSQLGFQCHLQIIYNSTRNFKSHRPTSPLFQITPVLNNNIQPNLFHNVYGKIEGTQSTHHMAT